MSPRTDRLSSIVRDRGKYLASVGAERLASSFRGRTSTFRGRTRTLVYVGPALAVVGVGSTTAASAASAATTSAATTASSATASGSAAAPLSIAALTAATHASAVTPATTTPAPAPHGTAPAAAASQPQVVTWQQVRDAINRQTNPVAARDGRLPAADRLMPVGTSGPQAWMPLSPAQLGNATTIVQQALNKRMGIRSAVVAVATAMQESQLVNLRYGDLDSLGLFQQRPSMGWGTAAQITDPSYAADVFLTALQRYQAGDPAWAWQPLWANAQAVQKSGFPFAYAKWESQAAGLVKQVAMRMH
jgi:hypothetical protein